MSNGVIPLTCAVQKYPWGKPGSTSLVAKCTGNQGDVETPYAELWMGTHPKAPSTLSQTGEKLSEWIGGDSNVRLGDVARQLSGNKDTLPFLLKILSVNKALSIQAHPTKEHAAKLHTADPKNYPDPNHKPEMAIALTVFEGMCGFRPVSDIISDLARLTSLHHLLSPNTVGVIMEETEPCPNFLKSLFGEVICLKGAVEAIHSQISTSPSTPTDELFLRIHSQHPFDEGLICIYLLNHVTLQPGEAMFLGPNKIHAYFSGMKPIESGNTAS